MIVVHACWSSYGLRLWGETSFLRISPMRRGGRGPGKPKPRPHPFAADYRALRDAVTRLGGVDKRAQSAGLTLHLPSYQRAPQPSPHVPRADGTGVEDAEPTITAPWMVTAFALTPDAALDFLLALPSAPEDGVVVADTLRGLGEIAKLALELVARGRVLPVLERYGAGWRAAWRPVLTDEADAERVAALRRALPAVCTVLESVGQPPLEPEEVVTVALGALVDAGVRGGLHGQKLMPPRRGRRTPAEQWLSALLDRYGWRASVIDEAERLHGPLEMWTRPLAHTEPGALRTCFRLSAPNEPEPVAEAVTDAGEGDRRPAKAASADDGKWRLDFLLQATDDPSLLVPAEQVWRTRGTLRVLKRTLEHPQERLLGDLGRALRLFPPLEPALRGARPSGAELDAESAYRFLREGAPLLAQAGFGVRVPAWWGRPSARLGVKLRARASTPKGEAEGRFGLGTLVAYDWQVSLGGETIPASEFRALAKAKVPLVRFRGEWVELKPEEVEAALRMFERGTAGQMSAAELLRLAAGAEGATEAGLPVAAVEAEGWLAGMLNAAGDAKVEPIPQPPGLHGTLRPYQARGVGWLAFLDGLGVGACLADDMGLGKAQPLDAKILTPTGWKPMGEIAVGDAVVGADGKPCTVVGVYPQGEKEVFRVTFSDGSATECCDDHLWRVFSPVQKRRGTPPRVLPLREIRARLRDAAGNTRWFIPMVAPVEFREEPLPLDPYLLGALLGDGGLSQRRVVFSTAEAEMAQRISERLPDGVQLVHKTGCDYAICGPVRGVRNAVLEALRRLSLSGSRSETKHIPEMYKLASPASRIALLQGLLDTDGHVRPNDNNVEFLTVSRRLAEDVVFLVQSLGGRARIRNKRTTHQPAYRMSICLPNGIPPFALRRKAETYRGRQKYPPSRAIIDVSPAGTKPVQCIAVDAPDHLYVTDDFIVTHNTVQLLALLLAERAKTGRGKKRRPPPTLLVCPMSLVGNWQREAAKFAPDLVVHVHHGGERLSGKALEKAVRGSDLVVTTYALAARDQEELAAVEWGRVVLDEAQNIKNAAARQTQAVRSLRAPRRIALTGTPVENRLAELWSILEFLNPGLLGSATEFRRSFATPIERYRDAERAAALQRLTRPFILRRLKTDRAIIRDLPEKQEMKVFCNLTREQATLYQATVDEMLQRVEESEGIERRGLILSTLLKLKQVCNHPAQLLQDRSALAGRSGKLARLEEVLEEVLAVEERALVFTQFAEMGHLLQRRLEERFAREVPFLHGGTSKAARDALVARFQAADGPPVLLLSLKAGGTGLTLTAANHVIHFDRWWNPAVEDQATDRAFRIGQKKNVQVRKLVCAGTLEERIDEMIEDKKRLADTVLGTGEAWLTELSTAELRRVVALSADAVAE